MRTSLTPLGELTRAELQGWAELAERAVEPNPFLHPDFVGPSATALRPRGLAILRCEDAGGWAACLPVVPVAWRPDLLGPGLASWRHPYCYLGTPLLATGAVADGAHGLLARVRGPRPAAFLACDWVRDGAVAEALAQDAPALTATDGFARGLVRRPPTGTPAMRPLSRKGAKELRRQQRGLAEALGGETRVVEHDDVAGAVREFLALEGSGWKGRRGTAMASQGAHAWLLEAVCERFAARGAVQLLSLRGPGGVASMQCNLRAQDAIFCFKVAYDEELARHSPGMQLEVAALELFERDARTAWMDSCAAPDNALIARLWPDTTFLRTVVIPRGAAGRAVVRATAPVMRAARGARRSVRSRRAARLRDA